MSARDVTNIFLGLVGMAILASCASKPAAHAVPTLNPTTFRPATPVPQTLFLKNAGFSLALQPGLDFEIEDSSVLLFDRGGEHFISLYGRPYIASIHTLESFLGTFLEEIAERDATFTQSDPYEISIDGMSGIAIDLSGTYSNAPIAGRAIAVSPGKDFIIFGIGLSDLQRRESGWKDSGSVIFEAILDSIEFMDEVKR